MKSIEVKFSEALEALGNAGKRKKYDEKVRSGMAIETKLNVAESLLKEAGIDINNLEEFRESVGNLAKIETFREEQYAAYRAGGMNEAEARSMASLCGKQR